MVESVKPATAEKAFVPMKGWLRPISFIPLHKGIFFSWLAILVGVGGMTLWRDFAGDWPTALVNHLPASFCYVLLASALAESVILVERKPQRLRSEEARTVAAVLALVFVVFQAVIVDAGIDKSVNVAALGALSRHSHVIPQASMTGGLLMLQVIVILGAVGLALYLRCFHLIEMEAPVEDEAYREDGEVADLRAKSVVMAKTGGGEIV